MKLDPFSILITFWHKDKKKSKVRFTVKPWTKKTWDDQWNPREQRKPAEVNNKGRMEEKEEQIIKKKHLLTEAESKIEPTNWEIEHARREISDSHGCVAIGQSPPILITNHAPYHTGNEKIKSNKPKSKRQTTERTRGWRRGGKKSGEGARNKPEALRQHSFVLSFIF